MNERRRKRLEEIRRLAWLAAQAAERNEVSLCRERLEETLALIDGALSAELTGEDE